MVCFTTVCHRYYMAGRLYTHFWHDDYSIHCGRFHGGHAGACCTHRPLWKLWPGGFCTFNVNFVSFSGIYVFNDDICGSTNANSWRNNVTTAFPEICFIDLVGNRVWFDTVFTNIWNTTVNYPISLGVINWFVLPYAFLVLLKDGRFLPKRTNG